MMTPQVHNSPFDRVIGAAFNRYPEVFLRFMQRLQGGRASWFMNRSDMYTTPGIWRLDKESSEKLQ